MLLCATTTPGCLLGPPVEGLPEEELHAPRIDRESVSPQPQSVFKVETRDGGCLLKEFTLGKVTDENVGDDLVVRWFLDWKGRDKLDGWLYDRNLLPNGSVERNDSIAIQFDMDPGWVLLDPTEPHTLTAVVADRPLNTSKGIGFADNEDGREGQWDVFQWSFVLESGGLCDEYENQ